MVSKLLPAKDPVESGTFAGPDLAIELKWGKMARIRRSSCGANHYGLHEISSGWLEVHFDRLAGDFVIIQAKISFLAKTQQAGNQVGGKALDGGIDGLIGLISSVPSPGQTFSQPLWQHKV